MGRSVGVAAAGCLALAACHFRTGSAAADAARTDGADAPRADTGDAAARLVSRGLVARYFVAEAASGQAPAALLDATTQPLDLAITYSPNLAYAGASGHRGLQWSTMAGDPARADAAIAGTKLQTAMTGQTTWTFEVAVDVQALSPPSGIDCRIITIASGTTGYGVAALVTSDLQHVSLFINGVASTWLVDETRGPIVLTAVVDTGQSAATRTQVYVDGVAATNGGGTEPTQGEGLVVAATDHLAIGNVDTGGRSFIGTETYAAIYDVALSAAEVAQNASALATDDDSP